MILIPIVIVTLFILIHHHYKNRNFYESAPKIAILLNTLLVWTFQFAHWIDAIHFDAASATFNQYFLAELLVFSNLFDAVGIFIYTWMSLEVVENEISGYWKKVFKYYKALVIFAYPLITYSIYFSMCFRYADSSYKYKHRLISKE